MKARGWVLLLVPTLMILALGGLFLTQARKDAHDLSWYLHVRPAGGDAVIVQLDMRKSDGELRRSVSEALQVLYRRPSAAAVETDLGTFHYEWSKQTAVDLPEKYEEPGKVKTAIFTQSDRSATYHVLANQPGRFPFALALEAADKALLPVGGGATEEAARSCAADCLLADMMRSFECRNPDWTPFSN